MHTPVIQEETSGCGIAAVANILGKTYAEMQAIANGMGIYASDEALWSDTQYVRRLLAQAGVQTSTSEIPFVAWETLPDLALLSIKHHQEQGIHYDTLLHRQERHFAARHEQNAALASFSIHLLPLNKDSR